MCNVWRLRANVSAQSNSIVAKSFSAEALAARNLVAGIPFAAKVLSRKTRTPDVSPM